METTQQSHPEMDRNRLIVPNSAVDSTLGCAFDVGGTMCKVIYKSKDPSPRKDHCTLHYETVEAAKLADCMKNVVEKASLTDHSIKVIHTTGVGIRRKVKCTIMNGLNARVENLPETSCFVEAFKFLARTCPKEMLVLPPPERGYRQGEELARQFEALNVAMNGPGAPRKQTTDPRSQNSSLPYNVTDKDLFPCLLVSMGTGGNFNVIEADGTSQTVDGTNRGGKHLLGLASLVLDTRSYDELMELAEKGDDHSANDYMKDIKAGEEGDFYDLFPDEMLIFSFGKAASRPKECFTRQDLARALVTNYTSDLSQVLCWIAKAHNCGRVFLGGGVFNHPLIRDEFTKHFVSRSYVMPPNDQLQSETELHFLRHGVYMGALGALLENNKHYSQQDR